MKRIAIFHNYMDNIGGAERVGLTLAQGLGADIYATVANRDAIRRMGFDVGIKTLGWIPTNAPWRQQMASWRFSRLDVADNYDAFIIDGDWAVSAAPRHKPNVWYV
ncbi:MAG: glycosyltransferase family 4 protein, partial [Nanoarchaeota archaeon]